MQSSTATNDKLSIEDFCRRAKSIVSADNDDDDDEARLRSLIAGALATENVYRGLFARHRESWEIPEVDDPHLNLVDVYDHTDIFKCLRRRCPEDTPRCLEIPEERLKPPGSTAIAPTLSEFELSWDCFTEGLLRFVDWTNVVAAGGSVAACLSPLPSDITSGGPSATRVKRRRYFHDVAYPASDVDLFLHGLTEEEAEKKLVEIYDAVQAANPYEVRAFRSAHAVTLVSQYPFRHVQVVLRLYNSPAEVLMGFDVDACACGYDGSRVYVCPRAALALETQSNTVDLTRRSPSYEMRLAKYAERGFDVVVPSLDRDRVDPFLYEKRFDQTQGLARLLLLERLRTPEDRLRYKIEGQLKKAAVSGNVSTNNWRLQHQLQKALRDKRNLARKEGGEGIVDLVAATGAEASDYSTVFLPWGPDWTAAKIERQMRKKDKLLNGKTFLPDGRVVKSTRPYKVHVCACGTMDEVIRDPFPNDPPVPDGVPAEELSACVRGRVSWLVDNPGRQLIGSFCPITDGDWTGGAYISEEAEKFIARAAADDACAIVAQLENNLPEGAAAALLHSRDCLGRTALHVAVLGHSIGVCRALLAHQDADADLLQARLADGRTALHLAAIHGFADVAEVILKKRQKLIDEVAESENDEALSDLVDILDIDGADWEVKLGPLQYAVAFGNEAVVKVLLAHGANARKLAVHKDRNASQSILALLVVYAFESQDLGTTRCILEMLVAAGASSIQVDTSGRTVWHYLAASPSLCGALRLFLELDTAKAQTLDILDKELYSSVYVATAVNNNEGLALLLGAGATAAFSEKSWSMRVQRSATDGSQHCHSYNFHDKERQEKLRCPMALSAQYASLPCLKVFLNHDATLANTTIQVRGSSYQETVPKRPLDLLETTRSEVAGKDGEAHQEVHMTNALQVCQAKRDRALTSYADEEHGSYGRYLWSLVLQHSEEAVAVALSQLEALHVSEEDEHDEALDLARIDEASKLIREAGGAPHPVQGGVAQGHNHPPAPQTIPQSPVASLEPLSRFAEMISFQPSNLGNIAQGYPHSRPRQLPLSDQQAACNLFSTAAAADTAGVPTATSRVAVCTVDCAGNTPLFLAVKAGSIETVNAIYAEATSQFERYKARLAQIESGAEPGTDAEPDGLASQLRRFNNLDLAAGEVPQNRGPTPDEMRQRLEAAEAAALQQNAESAEGDVLVLPESSVSPEALLFHRSVVLSRDVPRLSSLRSRLAEIQPNVFPRGPEPDDGSSSLHSSCLSEPPVRLRPIELAVLLGDLPMVRALCALLGSDDSFEPGTNGGTSSKPQDDKATDGEVGVRECKNSEDEDSIASEGYSYDDSAGEEYDSEDYSHDDYAGDAYPGHARQQAKPSSLTPAQQRWLLFGEGSINVDLGGMQLLQLAAALDDVPMVCAIAEFAAEHVLPRGAVAAWKRDVESAAPPVDKATEAHRNRVTAEIEATSTFYYQGIRVGRLPMWSDGCSNGEGSVALYPTLLQYALTLGAPGVARAIMKGDVDDALLGWISAENVTQRILASSGAKKHQNNLVSGIVAAAGWVVHHAAEKKVARAELSRRLIRATALDGAGRNALFYAPPTMIDEVVESVVLSESDGMSDRVAAKEALVEATSGRGSLTPLMAAASASDAERTRALLKIGSKRAATRGPKSWGALHLAIPAHVPGQKEKAAEAWRKARAIMEFLLHEASNEELQEMLLSPRAEHTPLMLAAERRADAETMALLVRKTAVHALPGLVRCDSDMNSALHLAVKAVLNSKADLDGFRVLLEQRAAAPSGKDESEGGKMFDVNAENARGATPFDLSLEAMGTVWDNESITKGQRFIHQGHQRRARRNKQALPKLPSDEEMTVKPSHTHRTFSLLNSVAGRERPGHRVSVQLEQVQGARKKATQEASNVSKTRRKLARDGINNRPKEEVEGYQSEPRGPPVVLSPSQNRTFMHGRAHQWNGWPTTISF